MTEGRKKNGGRGRIAKRASPTVARGPAAPTSLAARLAGAGSAFWTLRSGRAFPKECHLRRFFGIAHFHGGIVQAPRNGKRNVSLPASTLSRLHWRRRLSLTVLRTSRCAKRGEVRAQTQSELTRRLSTGSRSRVLRRNAAHPAHLARKGCNREGGAGTACCLASQAVPPGLSLGRCRPFQSFLRS